MKNTLIPAQQLSQLDLKVTRARVAILEILKEQAQPIDVAQIIAGFESKKIPVDQATVYRTLEIFYKNHLVDRLEFQEGKFRYELITSEHHHLVCERCGSVVDIKECPIQNVEQIIAVKQQFLIKRHALEFFGLCAQCQ